LDIFWLGHSSFRLKGKETAVITDPCPPDYGYAAGSLTADIVFVSHDHKGHNYLAGVTVNSRALSRPGEYEVKDVTAFGLPSYHDAVQGKERGKNLVFVFHIEGITVCHLGDIGHVPDAKLYSDIGNVDVLFLPVGDVTTINVAQAGEIMRRIAPKIVIPMHYKTPVFKGALEPVDKFLKESGAGAKEPQPKLSVNKVTLPAATQVVVLDYPRK